MSSLPSHSAVEPAIDDTNKGQRDYIPMILQAMVDRDITLRALSLKTRISKSRLGLLLHHDASKRANMTLAEFQTILTALGLNIIQAVIRVETIRDQALLRDERYATSLALLGSVFEGLPTKLIEALEELEGIDGTEVRAEWAEPLLIAVVERLVKEVRDIKARRARLCTVEGMAI